MKETIKNLRIFLSDNVYIWLIKTKKWYKNISQLLNQLCCNGYLKFTEKTGIRITKYEGKIDLVTICQICESSNSVLLGKLELEDLTELLKAINKRWILLKKTPIDGKVSINSKFALLAIENNMNLNDLFNNNENILFKL